MIFDLVFGAGELFPAVERTRQDHPKLQNEMTPAARRMIDGHLTGGYTGT